MTDPRIEVHDDAEALATAVAGELLTRLSDAQQSGGVPQICLTGGTIAGAVHREVARLAPDSDVDWSRVVLWWGDERFVGAADADRNDLQAREQLLDALGLDPANVHPIASSDVSPDAETAAATYGDELRSFGRGEFEITMLGVGPDAHVASLFPGFPQLDVDDTIAVAVHDSPKPPPTRVSLTFGALNRSVSVWFLVSGEEKADAVARSLAEDADLHTAPAAGVHGSRDTIWFLDRSSASRL